MTTIKFDCTSCMDCPKHEVQSDPDPNDWFCDDDKKVYCREAKRYSTVACRPYNLRKETTPIPDWCPLRADKS